MPLESLSVTSPVDGTSLLGEGTSNSDSISSDGSGNGGSSQPTQPVPLLPGQIVNVPLVAGASGGGIIGVVMVIFLIFVWRRHRLRVSNQAKRIESSLASNEAFAFPLHVLRANDFLQMDQLVVFEDARNQSMHEVIDLVSDARMLFGKKMGAKALHLVFLSHQWLALGSPGALLRACIHGFVRAHS